MTVERFTVGELESEAYLVYTDKSTEAVLIDAGGGYKRISERAKVLGKSIAAVFLTHGHIDHIAAADKFRKDGAKIGVSEKDAYMLKKGSEDNLARFLGINYGGTECDFTFRGGEEFIFEGFALKVFATPGHTAGSCCFLCDNVCFSGDTLFLESVGRTDLPTGNHEDLMSSLRALLTSLPPETKIYPGHGESTAAIYERRYNPYFSEAE